LARSESRTDMCPASPDYLGGAPEAGNIAVTIGKSERRLLSAVG
jgi:hypothetical protein